MTGYDPFSYGEIKLGDKDQGKSKEPDGEMSPDDILFEDAGPAPQATFGTESEESDWALPEQDPDPLIAAVGAEEPSPDFAPPKFEDPGPAAAMPEPAAEAGQAFKPLAPRTAPSAESHGGRPQRTGERMPRRPAATRPLARGPRQRQLRVLGSIVPPLCLVAGFGAGAWFYLIDQNVVMAGIVATAGFVGAAFTRLLFR